MKTLDKHNRERKEEIEKLGLEPIKKNAVALCPKCRAEMYYLTPGLCFSKWGRAYPKHGYNARNVCVKVLS